MLIQLFTLLALLALPSGTLADQIITQVHITSITTQSNGCHELCFQAYGFFMGVSKPRASHDLV